MFRLCALIIFFSEFVFAAPNNFSVAYSNTNTKGEPLATSDGSQTSSNQTISLKKTTETLSKYYTLGYGVDLIKNDYSNYEIRDESGNTSLLKDSFNKQERLFNVSGSFQKDRVSISTEYKQNLGDSPFYQRGISFSGNYSFFNNAIFVGAEYSRLNIKQPHNYYLSPVNAQNIKRPEELNVQIIKTFFETIYSENLKGRYALIYGDRPEDRPYHLGLETTHSYSINDKNFVRLDFGLLKESRNQKLKNERGYYDVSFIELQYSHYLNYDLLLEFGYGLVYEKENKTYIGEVTQVVTDSYVLGISYSAPSLNIGISYKYLDSNVEYSSKTIGGNLTWENTFL